MAREKVDLIGSASKELMVDLLPVLDDFERALKSVSETQNLESAIEGMELIHHKLHASLERHGLKAEDAVGQPFDADLHEALTEIPAPSEEMKGKVVDQVEKGYRLNDKIIRFAKVVVGK
jgi:molecular chaperone GrpE